MKDKKIIFENSAFRLVLSADCRAESLVLKDSGAECLAEGISIPFFAVDEARPYHNEIKLANPTRAMSFGANRVRLENDRLIVGFELICFEAVVRVDISPLYMTFTLEDFITTPDSFGLGVIPMKPPVESFRLVNLPLKPRERFGKWLNVLADGEVAVNVLAASPYGRVGGVEARDCVTLYGETCREARLKNESIGIIVSKPESLLDAIDSFERELGLPRGAESRRSPFINCSYYWGCDVTPDNVEEHIKYAKAGGFKLMSLYYTSFLKEEGGFISLGNYRSYREEYPRGLDDLADMLTRIKSAGIKVGLHVLPTHIGLHSKYLTPVADRRLNLSSRYTLARPLSAEDTEIFVDECPSSAPTYEKSRVIRIMGELVSYTSFTEEPPYRFLGCKRGFNATRVGTYESGTALGVLDISEFCANSAYINQNNDLQDEIAERIAEIYGAGFEFMYFDGAEGVNPPFDVNVALAQYRIYKKLPASPLFCEGAAKSHFSWHMISGGNAFDIFEPAVFKEMMLLHPFAEAEQMANDYTRVNFGWWSPDEGHRPDTFEYATSLAAAWDCPGSFRGDLDRLRAMVRTDDILETFRLWEMARGNGFITEEKRRELRQTEHEHTLLLNEEGELELARWTMYDRHGLDGVSIFLLERSGLSYAVIWDNLGQGTLTLDDLDITVFEGLGGEDIALRRDGVLTANIGRKRFLCTSDEDRLISALSRAVYRRI